MKKAFILAAVAAIALVPETQAADLSWLDGPYEFLDEVVMIFYKPLIWYLIIAPLQGLACATLTPMLLDIIGVTNGLGDDATTDMCDKGVEMYWDQFFYGGAIGNQPYDLGWAWTP